MDQLNCSFPTIIWVASRPPIPPFSGPTSKSLCGIDALTAATDMDVVTFVKKDDHAKVAYAFSSYWKDRQVRVHFVEPGQKAHPVEALVAKRFQSGITVERSALPAILERLEWNHPSRLLVFDDIVLAPFAKRYGANAILSPHDCMSEMFRSHSKLSPMGWMAIKHYMQYSIARYYEKSFYHLVLLVHVITHRDRVWLEKINPKARYQVVPNADLLNPGFSKTEQDTWDVMVWGDLRISSIARGTREFLQAIVQDPEWSNTNRVLVVGRVPSTQAYEIIGESLASVAYAAYLEDDNGKIRHAKITVIPDSGGAGIKNRCVNLLSSGKCLACLYPQMEGVDKECDRGAINAGSLADLAKKIVKALREGSYHQIGEMGQLIFQQEYSLESTQRLWIEMIERALAIRHWLNIENPGTRRNDSLKNLL